MAVSSGSLVQPDLTLLLDLDGVIRKATLSKAVGDEGLTDWVGRPWFDTVAEMAGANVLAIVADARSSGVSAFRQITQRFPSGAELPMEFTTVRLGDGAGLLAIGRSLQAVGELRTRLVAAQHAREQDYWKLREVETRYRLLFDAAHDPMLLLTLDSLRVVEANPAALRVLGVAPGWDFVPEVAAADLDALRAMLQRVRDQGRAPGILVHLGQDRTPWVVRASLLSAAAGPVFLLQIAATAGNAGSGPAALHEVGPAVVDTMLQHMPDAFVVIDVAGIIRRVNDAFLDLVQMGSQTAVLGQSLGRWLGMPGADTAGLIAEVKRHRSVRLFATRLRGEHDIETEVEVSASCGSDVRPALIGVLMRDVGRRDRSARRSASGLSGILAGIVGQTGRITLLDMVKEVTAAVERHAIDDALTSARGNRTAAADLLGLSRQSLYVKLNRYAVEGAVALGSDRDD